MAKPQINVDIKPRGTASAYVATSFDEGKEALAKEGYRIISLQENARLRMQEGKDAFVSQNGNWTREGVLYVPGKGKYLTKNSPIMANAKQATDCHRKGEDFYLTAEQVEQSLDGAVELTGKSIPTNGFGSSDIAVYAFGEEAQKYGDFLKEAKITEMPVYLASMENKPFARQIWFRSLGGWSELYGDGRLLDSDYGVRGVQDSAEGTVAKKGEVYTPAQMEKALKELGFPGVSKGLVEKLRTFN